MVCVLRHTTVLAPKTSSVVRVLIRNVMILTKKSISMCCLQNKIALVSIEVSESLVNNTMYTYEQVHHALSYFYLKQKVLADGVSTTQLDI